MRVIVLIIDNGPSDMDRLVEQEHIRLLRKESEDRFVQSPEKVQARWRDLQEEFLNRKFPKHS